jgi:hypothetical protein
MQQGATFNPVLKYSQPQFVVKVITGITKSGQAVVTAAGHGLTIDWPVWIVGAVGMEQINHRPDVLNLANKAYFGYFVDANSLRLNVDTTRFNAYASGGELLYHPPVNLTGYTARMQIRATLDATVVIVSLTTENGGITLGGTAGTLALLLTAVATAAFTFSTAVYDLEIISAGGVVTRLLSGNVVLSKEVTR